MSRRDFLRLAAGSAILGAVGSRSRQAAAGPARAPAKTRGICFDLFTLFDPRSVDRTAATIVGELAPALCAEWRVRQFEYSWLHAAAGRYVDFETVTHDALAYVVRSRGLHLSSPNMDRLVAAYSELEPWPDTRSALEEWQRQGLRLAPLANYSPRMIARLMDHSRLASCFDAFISTDAARTYKPDPRAYALGPTQLGLRRDELVFAAFGGWDAAGASWFGFRSFWVNRLSVTAEELSPGPAASGSTFAELSAFLTGTTAHSSKKGTWR